MQETTVAQGIRCVKGVVRGTKFKILIEAENTLKLPDQGYQVSMVTKQPFDSNESIVTRHFDNDNMLNEEKLIELIVPLPKDLIVKKVFVHGKFKDRNLLISNDGDWFLDHLFIETDEDYNSRMSFIKSRIEDNETLMFQSIQSAEFGKYDVRYKIASFVIFCYKAIEFNMKDVLLKKYGLFEKFISQIKEFENKKGNVRNDGRQIILSLFTVKWHVDVFLGKHNEVIESLEFIYNQPTKHPYYKPSLSMNYGNASFLLGYCVQFLGNKDGAIQIWDSLYRYYRNLVAHLPHQSEVPPAHFEDINKCHSAVYLALSGWRELQDNTNTVFSKNKKVLSVVRRVQTEEFDKQFLLFLKWCKSKKNSYKRIQKDYNLNLTDQNNDYMRTSVNKGQNNSNQDIFLLEEKIKKLKKRNKELENINVKYNMMRQSRFWRYSKPFRKVLSKISKL